MDNASFQFILFGLVVVLLSNLRSTAAWRSTVLLISSFVFLALLAPSVVVLLPFAAFLLVGYASIALLRRGFSATQAWSVVGIVVLYAWLKKYTFLPEGLSLIHILRADHRALDPLVPFRLAVLSNGTIDFIVPALVATAARHGIALEVIQPSYDQVAQEALTPDSRVNTAKPDAVLFALDYRALPLKVSPGDSEAAAATVQGALGYLQALRNGIKTNANAICIFQTFVPPAETLFGSLDRALPGTLQYVLQTINQELAASCVVSGDVLLDVAALAGTVGLANWHDTQLRCV